MLTPLKLNTLLAENANANRGDVLAIKTLLRKLGLYKAPEWGVTEFPDSELFKAIRAFQEKAGLKVDGRMKPDGETQTALHQAARRLQGLGRNGDTVLAHISPAEARMLKAKGGAGTVNPKTGLLEFYVAGKDGGQYIWRTQGDSKVRSSHAERDGKTFSWDEPPEGGHPGEAPNCRCTAEDVGCSSEKFKRNEILEKLHSVEAKAINLRAKVHNTKLKIEADEADIEFYEAVNTVAMYGGILTVAPHPAGRFVGWAFQIGEKISEGVLMEIRASLAKNTAKLQELEKTLRPLENELKNLEVERKHTEEKLQQCEAGG